jgi:hypothetical protein
MSYCPSQDWDRHVDELDAAADARMRFYVDHGDAIERITIALIGSGYLDRIVSENESADVVLLAERIAFLIYGEQE